MNRLNLAAVAMFGGFLAMACGGTTPPAADASSADPSDSGSTPAMGKPSSDNTPIDIGSGTTGNGTDKSDNVSGAPVSGTSAPSSAGGPGTSAPGGNGTGNGAK